MINTTSRVGYLSILVFGLGLVATLLSAADILLLQRRAWLTSTALITRLVIVLGIEVALHQVLQPHQRARIESFTNPSLDPLCAGWNVIQAKTAIGSGGLGGKGFMEGTHTQLRSLPAQWTDFMFCVGGEVFGFVGASILLLLFTLLLLRLLQMAYNQKHPFAQLVIICVSFL